MAAWQFANTNSIGTTLNNGGNMLSGDASCIVASASALGAPTSPQFMILIDAELILVGAVAGNTFSSLSRGQEGTTAAGHNNGAAVFAPLTAGMLTGAFLRADATNAVEVTGTDMKPSGLTGSTAAARFIGGTASGVPVSGTQAVGDVGVDQTGRVWVATVAGTPGTFKSTASIDLANTFSQVQTFTADVTLNARAVFGAAASKIVPGVTSMSMRNNADNADNLKLTDAGLMTLRNGLLLPGSAGGAVVGGYTSVPIKIYDNILGVAAATVAITGIPANGRHLTVWIYARSDAAAVTNQNVTMRFNNDATANYDTEGWIMQGSAAGTPAEVLGASAPLIGAIPAATATANYFGSGHIRVPHYAGTTGNKLAMAQWATGWTNTTGGAANMDFRTAKWRTTGTAVNELDFLAAGGNFVIGSAFSVTMEP